MDHNVSASSFAKDLAVYLCGSVLCIGEHRASTAHVLWSHLEVLYRCVGYFVSVLTGKSRGYPVGGMYEF